MRALLFLLLLAACAGTFTQTQDESNKEPVQVSSVPEQADPPPKKKQEKPVTVIIHQKPEPSAICVPLAADERKRIIQALDCLLEAAEKPVKP